MISAQVQKEYAERIKRLRTRLLIKYPFFGILNTKMRFGLDPTVGTAATDGTRILLDPSFKLDDRELDFIVMHELLHIALDHPSRGKGYHHVLFNVACDIVVNSTIMNVMGVTEMKIAGNDVYHTVPNGSEGMLYSAEQVYSMLLNGTDIDKNGGGGDSGRAAIDSHGKWREMSEARRAEMSRLVRSAVMSVNQIAGNVPSSVERELAERAGSKLDWRQVLAEFVQEDIYDYSFSSPDKRYNGDIIMPDYRPDDYTVKNLLFMIDTSGSMSDSEISAAFSEICGAIDQFDGMLSGKLGFFDCDVTEPVPFETVHDVLKIRPRGGGGTSADPIFDYIDEHMSDDPPSSIIILTDGYMRFPDEQRAHGVPVLWIIDTPHGPAPDWGTVIHMGEE